MDKLATMRQLQEQLHCSRPTGYRLIADGHVEALHIGRALRITQRSIDAFIERQISQEVTSPDNEAVV